MTKTAALTKIRFDEAKVGQEIKWVPKGSARIIAKIVTNEQCGGGAQVRHSATVYSLLDAEGIEIAYGIGRAKVILVG